MQSDAIATDLIKRQRPAGPLRALVMLAESCRRFSHFLFQVHRPTMFAHGEASGRSAAFSYCTIPDRHSLRAMA
ncbi:hypothetical protein D0839_02890 [Bordetella avium]|nr:hypothetical protein C0J07_04705 [Bordetella avium]RIQ13802.1 hypothetical protein D0432_05865 [Bordetella avium]RIQ17126.1 hypothetical protein D0850_12660 [Bordetella avium]RIQ36148.1 hypothetical protein D0849_00260 [Bordetella avium]RIQ39498.1 hypothetical protein D0848_03840 [Bordetella avium]